ncbi:polyphosphate kinase 1 [Pedobacter immunditicola]|uniref:polyphosphate kinase 1 n=1 Tax=Pedobacter immunditicola TaxID=3133440 RepID=UPI0030A78D54
MGGLIDHKKYTYINRDLSWIGFNGRVLLEAEKAKVPLLERINFLSIYSSNLDEFYRVRIPVLMALKTFKVNKEDESVEEQIKNGIQQQQEKYGEIIQQCILPELEKLQVNWIYHRPIPAALHEKLNEIFFNEVMACVQVLKIGGAAESFFAENNALYQVVILQRKQQTETIALVRIPSHVLPRFYAMEIDGRRYVVFLEDIIKHHLSYLFPEEQIRGVFNVKITRDAELNLDEEVGADMAAMIEQKLALRDYGFATRLLCQPGIPLRCLYSVVYALKLQKAAVVIGGVYHNLKDLSQFPLKDKTLKYPEWPAVPRLKIAEKSTLFSAIEKRDILIHVPYQKYDPVLRFFNEAAQDQQVEAIYCTLYRLANPSRIVQALISASKNGKDVSVMLELKARFDEANNIKWARQMKAAGIAIYYSSIDFKVHAKVALVKRRPASHSLPYLGLLSTGNMNETTAKFYTDHVLFTACQPMLEELEALFRFLPKKKKKPATEDFIPFKHLLVAQFNLQKKFLELIDREIENVQQGLPAKITIKLNNLEERVLISKLYEASQAGVRIQLLIRTICCLVPGLEGQSENITVKRIVGRYLEHGRVFIFHNNGDEEVFMGSADWMNRNIYTRIEVCFPIYDPQLKKELIALMALQLDENINDPQEAIYQYLKLSNDTH